jgi:protein TonB
MFDHYMQYQRVDPRRRLRLQIAAASSGVITFSLVTFMWVANKLNISRVDPPPGIEFIMTQLVEEEAVAALPPPPPPPPAAAEEEEEEEEEIPEEEAPIEEIVQPKETPDKVPDAKTSGAKGPKVPGGVPGGMPGGVPGGVPGGIPGGVPGGIPGGIATKREVAEKDVAKAPISAVRSQAIYDPNPDQRKLAGTKAATFDKRPGSVKIAFCVDGGGKPTDVRVSKKFPNDPQVDQIVKETVQKWRFKPFIVDGKPKTTCSEATFDIQFE